MKRVICLFLVVLLAFSLSGCAEGLHERMLILGIGVDYSQDMYQVSVRLSVPEEEKERVMTASGATMYEALNALSLQSGNTQMYSHCYFLVFGRGIVENGLSDCMEFLTGSLGSSPNIPLFATEQEAQDILLAEREGKLIPSEEISNFWRSQKNSGKVIYMNLLNFVDQTGRGGESALLPLLYAGEETLSVRGTALFRQYKMVGKLDERETMGYLAVKGQLKNAVLAAREEEIGEITGEVISVRPQIQTDSAQVVNIILQVECSLLSSSQGKETEEKLRSVLEQELTQVVLSAARVAYQRKCDIFLLADSFLSQGEQRTAGDWQEQLAEIQFQVETQVEIQEKGIE